MHARSRRARWTLLVLLLLPGVVVAAPLGTVRPAQAAGADLRLPARYAPVPHPLRPVGASVDAVAFTVEETFGARTTYVKVPRESKPRRFDRSQGVGVAGRFVLLADESGYKVFTMVDTATWTTRVLPITFPHKPQGPLADGGWYSLDQYSGYSIARYAADDSLVRRVALPKLTAGNARGDGKGAVLTVTPADVYAPAVAYVDWASGRLSILWRAARKDGGFEFLDHALSPRYVAVRHGSYVVRRSRGTLAITGTRSLPARAGTFAITDAATSWTTIQGATATTTSVFTSAESSPTSAVRAAAGLPDVYQFVLARGSGFVVVAGATSRTRGLYTVAVGAGSLGSALALSPPTAAWDFVVGPGQVVFMEPQVYSGRFRAVSQGIDVAADGPRVRGAERVLSSGNHRSFMLLAGGTLAAPEDMGTTYQYDVIDGGRSIARVGTSGSAVAFSGSRLVMREQAPAGAAERVLSRIVDIRSTPQPDRIVPGESDLDGSNLASVTADGAVVLRDLDLPDLAPRPVWSATATPADARFPHVAVADGWVARWWTRPDGVGVSGAVRQVDTGREVPLPAVDLLSLSGGRAAWLDPDDRDVHVLDLLTGIDDVVGAERARPVGRGHLALAPDFVAWSDDDGSTVVHPLDEPPGPVELTGGEIPTAFSRAGLRLRLEADRAVDSVQLTVTDAVGAVVATVASTAADGGLRPTWNTRLPDGSLAPPGQYAWRITAFGGGQPVVGNTSTPMSGTATLDVSAPDLRATAPAVVSDISTSAAFRVGWASSDTSAVFDVTVSARGHQDNGSYGWAPPRYWKRGVAAGSAVYGGSGLPYAPKGLMRLVISSRDAAGNKTSVTKDVLVPADDGAWPQQLSTGWVRVTGNGLYGGGAREATRAGRTLTLRATTNRVLIIGTRCTTCGRFALLIDGRVVRTVDTYGSRATRRRLVDVRLSGPAAAHTIVLRVAGTSGRPRVQVDAVGLVA